MINSYDLDKIVIVIVFHIIVMFDIIVSVIVIRVISDRQYVVEMLLGCWW